MASKVDSRLLKSTKFPAEFNQKVDTEKVNLPVMKKWIAKRICEILGSEDDVLIELCCNLIEGSRHPDIKSVQIQITGFLDKDTAPFCKELWNLLLSAQSNPQGVPKELLEAKKLELTQGKMDADRAHMFRTREPEDSKEERRDSRQAGDSWHAQARRGDRAFGNRDTGGYGRSGPRSASPMPRGRGTRDSYRRDSYVPQSRRGRDQALPRRHGRSPSESPSRPRSRTRSMSSDSSRSPRRPRRRASPSRPQYSRKRSRSPRHDPRYQRRDDYARDRRYAPRNPRSSTPDASPAAKRRRRSLSRSSSAGPRRRNSSSFSRTQHTRKDNRGRSRNRSSSRSRSRSRSVGSSRYSTHNRRRESMAERRRERRYTSSSGDSSDYQRGRGQVRGRSREDSTSRRRNISSEFSSSPVRGQTADVLEDEPHATSSKPIVSIEKEDEEAQKKKAATTKRSLARGRTARDEVQRAPL